MFQCRSAVPVGRPIAPRPFSFTTTRGRLCSSVHPEVIGMAESDSSIRQGTPTLMVLKTCARRPLQAMGSSPHRQVGERALIGTSVPLPLPGPPWSEEMDHGLWGVSDKTARPCSTPDEGRSESAAAATANWEASPGYGRGEPAGWELSRAAFFIQSPPHSRFLRPGDIGRTRPGIAAPSRWRRRRSAPGDPVEEARGPPAGNWAASPAAESCRAAWACPGSTASPRRRRVRMLLDWCLTSPGGWR